MQLKTYKVLVQGPNIRRQQVLEFDCLDDALDHYYELVSAGLQPRVFRTELPDGVAPTNLLTGVSA